MIELLDQITPAASLALGGYTPRAVINWLHGGDRDFDTTDDVVAKSSPSSGPVIPRVIFTVGGNLYDWTESNW